jgi:hypothetical protein
MSTLAERPAVTAADRARSPSVHVFALPEGYAVADAPAPASAPNYVKRGSTANFVVYYDTAVATGATLADAILSSCEWEYAMMKGWFGGITPASLPFTIYIDVGSFGAYHANCLATEIHCGAAAGNNSDLVRMLMAAEMDEVFMARVSRGFWRRNCIQRNSPDSRRRRPGSMGRGRTGSTTPRPRTVTTPASAARPCS